MGFISCETCEEAAEGVSSAASAVGSAVGSAVDAAAGAIEAAADFASGLIGAAFTMIVRSFPLVQYYFFELVEDMVVLLP